MTAYYEDGLLIHGDCLEVLPEFNQGSVDMVLADLPYGTTKLKWDSEIDLNLLWPQYKRIAKKTAPILLFGQTPFDKVLGSSNLEMLKYEWIWEKTSATGHLNANKCPMKAHENILVFYDQLPVYNPQKTQGHLRKVATAEHKRNTKQGEVYGEYKATGYDSTERYPRDVIKFASDKQKNRLHPTQKPVKLLEYFIKTYSNPGDTILDNASGSASLAEACINTGRRFLCIEKDFEIFKVGNERVRRIYESLGKIG